MTRRDVHLRSGDIRRYGQARSVELREGEGLANRRAAFGIEPDAPEVEVRRRVAREEIKGSTIGRPSGFVWLGVIGSNPPPTVDLLTIRGRDSDLNGAGVITP